MYFKGRGRRGKDAIRCVASSDAPEASDRRCPKGTLTVGFFKGGFIRELLVPLTISSLNI